MRCTTTQMLLHRPKSEEKVATGNARSQRVKRASNLMVKLEQWMGLTLHWTYKVRFHQVGSSLRGNPFNKTKHPVSRLAVIYTCNMTSWKDWRNLPQKQRNLLRNLHLTKCFRIRLLPGLWITVLKAKTLASTYQNTRILLWSKILHWVVTNRAPPPRLSLFKSSSPNSGIQLLSLFSRSMILILKT